MLFDSQQISETRKYPGSQTVFYYVTLTPFKVPTINLRNNKPLVEAELIIIIFKRDSRSWPLKTRESTYFAIPPAFHNKLRFHKQQKNLLRHTFIASKNTFLPPIGDIQIGVEILKDITFTIGAQ